MYKLFSIIILIIFSSVKVYATETKGVITTIQPINALVSAVVGNTGKTISIIPADISPHEFKLKPSDAKILQDGNIIFYVSNHLESSITKVFENLPKNIKLINLIEETGIKHLAIRDKEAWERHDHHGHEEHDDHAEEGHEGHDHENLGFKVTGILKPTGTPIDNAVYVSLAGIEAMHTGWIGNQKVIDVSVEQIMQNELKPKTISAIFVSLKNRTQVFQFQRDVLNYKKEAISSVMPGITLSRLWALTGNVDKAFKIITFFIIIIALLGMIAMTIAGLNSRRREMAILRSVGASPTNIVSLLLVESIIISLISCIVGYILMIIIFHSMIKYKI